MLALERQMQVYRRYCRIFQFISSLLTVKARLAVLIVCKIHCILATQTMSSITCITTDLKLLASGFKLNLEYPLQVPRFDSIPCCDAGSFFSKSEWAPATGINSAECL